MAGRGSDDSPSNQAPIVHEGRLDWVPQPHLEPVGCMGAGPAGVVCCSCWLCGHGGWSKRWSVLASLTCVYLLLKHVDFRSYQPDVSRQKLPQHDEGRLPRPSAVWASVMQSLGRCQAAHCRAPELALSWQSQEGLDPSRKIRLPCCSWHEIPRNPITDFNPISHYRNETKVQWELLHVSENGGNINRNRC